MTQLYPSSTLLMGPGGTGKTTSIVTLLAKGLAVNMVATEPSAPNRVLEEAKRRGVDSSKFHWKFISPSPPAWSSLIDSANIVNTMALKDIANMNTGIAKSDGKQWIAFLQTLQNFVSDRDGQALGDCTSWGNKTALVLDGLSGINEMSRNLTVGLKPNPAPGEWGVMQSNILNLLRKLCADCTSYFVCIAHVERENNEITGVQSLTVSTLGAKLAPKLPPLFTNVIYAKRIGADFFWSTADTGVDTKNGDLPLSDKLPPSFAPIVDGYAARMASLSAAGAVPPAPTAAQR